VGEFRLPQTGDFSPSPSIRLTVTGGRIAGDRDAGLYPGADAGGAAGATWSSAASPPTSSNSWAADGLLPQVVRSRAGVPRPVAAALPSRGIRRPPRQHAAGIYAMIRCRAVATAHAVAMAATGPAER
jgi:hypothetical protein